MASWLTHLRVAERIKQKVSGIDFPYFIIGSIAPDSGVPDDTVFFKNYMVPEKIITRSDSTRSFLWGYYFHLIIDKLWVEEYFKPLKMRYESEFKDPDKDFVDFIREEMFSLDFEYLKEQKPELIDQLKSFNGNINFFNEFDPDYIYKSKNRIVDFYNGEPLHLDRANKYLNSQIIEEFIIKASEKCINILVV